MIEPLEPRKHLVHTVTFNNNKGFADHERIAKKLEPNIFFAHPYAAWKIGVNENSNGLLRQSFLKSYDFFTVAEEEAIMS